MEEENQFYSLSLPTPTSESTLLLNENDISSSSVTSPSKLNSPYADEQFMGICSSCFSQSHTIIQSIAMGDASQQVVPCSHCKNHPFIISIMTLAGTLNLFAQSLSGTTQLGAYEYMDSAATSTLTFPYSSFEKGTSNNSENFGKCIVTPSTSSSSSSSSSSSTPSTSTSSTSLLLSSGEQYAITKEKYIFQGVWKECIDRLSLMTVNFSGQVRDIAEVCTAVAHGDLTKKITVEVKGEMLILKNTINTMVDQLNSFASEVTRVAHEVGTEGKLGVQAHVQSVHGTWKLLTDNVNTMASNLTAQVRDIASVSKAVACGDLSKKITVNVKGEFLDLKNTINTMVDQLQTFATEVTRVSLEVGTKGILGGQAVVKNIDGTWKSLTDNVNLMASNLTAQVRDIATVCKAVANGDLSKTVTVNVEGEILELKSTINTMVAQLRTFAAEVTRVAREVGTEGNLGGQAQVEGVDGTWKILTDNVNTMASNLTDQVRDIASVCKAVACGDLGKKITVDVKGELLELKNTINTMVDQLQTFATEVTRVSLEVGTEGRLGGQAVVKDVKGMWKNLTDNVNLMAANLTGQVRSIALVTTAVACGDLSKKITVDVNGEVRELKTTVNNMVDQLRTFAAEVTRVAREVGTEGKLGVQAQVKDVGGTWKDLTDNVNIMAANLTAQVRDIADVSKAVATGDLSKKVTVNVKGEILDLKNTINTMMDRLRTFATEVSRVALEVGTEGKLGK